MRISSSVRPCSLENWVNLSRRSGLSSLVRPAAKSRVRDGPCPLQDGPWAWEIQQGLGRGQGRRTLPSRAMGCPAAPSRGTDPHQNTLRAPCAKAQGGWHGGWQGHTVEQHHGGGAGALGDPGGHQSVLIIVGLHHADVVFAAPACEGWNEHISAPSTKPRPHRGAQTPAGYELP